MTRTRLVPIGVAALVLLVLVAGWFLALGPKRSATAALRAQQTSVQQQEQQLRSSIALLQQQAAGLPAQQRRLALFATKMPSDVELPDLVRDLTAAGRRAGGDVTVITPQPPAAPDAGTAGSTGTAAPTGTAGATSPRATGGYQVVPLSITVEGHFDTVEKYLDALETTPRAILVSGVAITRPTDAGTAGAGSSPVLAATITASAFVAPPATSPAAAPAPATGAPTTAGAAGSPS